MKTTVSPCSPIFQEDIGEAEYASDDPLHHQPHEPEDRNAMNPANDRAAWFALSHNGFLAFRQPWHTRTKPTIVITINIPSDL